ncbi:MAG: hypothetical protein B7Z78_13655 [Rhodospirillales bacterium 20-60-12]|nr:MAG: hypothetical protein B7Z78_13655 [Rhodospirillales bacterium 20-60-12]
MDEAEARANGEPPEYAEPSLSLAPTLPPPSAAVSFKIVLGEAYYNQGFINPGVEASAYLGGDGDPIEVAFDDGAEAVLSRINRRANPSGSVRIVRRNRQIAKWFQAHFQKGDIV